jgi:uncharacterized membrane protein
MLPVTKKYNRLKILYELPLLLLTGGVGYCALEILFRGRTHPSMALCGAICFFLIYRLNEEQPTLILPLRALLSASLITGVELISGCILNLWLGLDVWDYSTLPYHLWGQICLPFFIIWAILCVPVCGLCTLIRRLIFLENA